MAWGGGEFTGGTAPASFLLGEAICGSAEAWFPHLEDGLIAPFLQDAVKIGNKVCGGPGMLGGST